MNIINHTHHYKLSCYCQGERSILSDTAMTMYKFLCCSDQTTLKQYSTVYYILPTHRRQSNVRTYRLIAFLIMSRAFTLPYCMSLFIKDLVLYKGDSWFPFPPPTTGQRVRRKIYNKVTQPAAKWTLLLHDYDNIRLLFTYHYRYNFLNAWYSIQQVNKLIT